MTASPSSSTTVRSCRNLGFTAGNSFLPGQQAGFLELLEDPLHVLGHDVGVHAGELDDGGDHLLGRGLSVAQVPDGQRRFIEQVHRARGWVVGGVPVPRLPKPDLGFAYRASLPNRQTHRSTVANSSRIPFCMTNAAASSLEWTPSLPRTFWMCVLAVWGLMTRAWAMASLSAPPARRARTSFSLLVSLDMRLRASSCSLLRRMSRARSAPSIRRGMRVSPRWMALAASISSARGLSLVRYPLAPASRPSLASATTSTSDSLSRTTFTASRKSDCPSARRIRTCSWPSSKVSFPSSAG